MNSEKFSDSDGDIAVLNQLLPEGVEIDALDDGSYNITLRPGLVLNFGVNWGMEEIDLMLMTTKEESDSQGIDVEGQTLMMSHGHRRTTRVKTIL